ARVGEEPRVKENGPGGAARITENEPGAAASFTEVGPGGAENYVGHTRYVFDVAFSPSWLQLASGSQDMTVHLWDVTTTGTGVNKG
ncbi:hypothetical protein BGZ95_006091, partial [Linnemannia exigua]